MSPSSKPIRVAFDMTLVGSNMGGSGAYARGLLDALRGTPDVEVSTIGARKRGAPSTLSWLLFGARNTLRVQGPDLLHSPGFIAPEFPGKKFVVTIHDLSLSRMPEGQALEWRLYFRYVVPNLVRRAAAVITPTETTKRDVIEALGVPPQRIAVTPYGVAPQFFNHPGSSAPARDEPRILFAGPPIKRKNLDAVLRVLASAPQTSALRRSRLAITGAVADDFPRYRQWISDHGLAARVDWLGMVPFQQLPALYAAASVLAYPSFIEGFGFPPLEAMAAGTPVVASDASCLPEVLGEAAILVDPNDDAALAAALESVLTDPTRREQLVAAGAAWARRYTWKRCAEETVEVYRSALLNTA